MAQWKGYSTTKTMLEEKDDVWRFEQNYDIKNNSPKILQNFTGGYRLYLNSNN